MRALLTRSSFCLALLVCAPAFACDRGDFVVAIDPGHTRANPCATSARGVPEVQFNEALARAILDELRRTGFGRAFLTVEDQAEIALSERADRANEAGARLFLSIHHDSVQPQYLSTWGHAGGAHLYSDVFSGYSLFVSAKNADEKGSFRMAELLGSEFRQRCLHPTLHHAEKISGESRDLIDRWRGIYRFDDLVVLKTTRMPAVLMEAGIIVNRQDELELGRPTFRRLLAAAVGTAVAHFCAGESPALVAASHCAESGTQHHDRDR
jgi:N-acetylmuramoyl-L-alanine amidase